METKHIHSAFDDELNLITTQLISMGGMVEDAIRLTNKSLKKGNAQLAEIVVNGDEKIDLLEEAITNSAIELLALRQPQAKDLRTIVVIMKIATSLERIGDYTKNIAKRVDAIIHKQGYQEKNSIGSVRRLTKNVQAQLKDTLDSFIQQDQEKADVVILKDEDIDQMYNSLFREQLTHMMEDPRNISTSMHLLFIAKNLERIGDHLTGIAEQIIFLVSGELPKDNRSKLVATNIDLDDLPINLEK